MKKGELKDNLFKKLKKKSQKSIPISCSSVRKYSIRIWRRTKVNLSFYSGWFISWSLFGVYKINTCVNLLLKLILILLVFFIKKDDYMSIHFFSDYVDIYLNFTNRLCKIYLRCFISWWWWSLHGVYKINSCVNLLQYSHCCFGCQSFSLPFWSTDITTYLQTQSNYHIRSKWDW